MSYTQPQLEALCTQAQNGDSEAMLCLVEAFRPLLGHILTHERAEVARAEREEIEAEAVTSLLEYLVGGGEPHPAKVAAVLRSKIRRHRLRPVKLTDGEELVLRIAAGARAEAAAQGRRLEGAELRDEVWQRCLAWSRARGGDEAEVLDRLSRRGLTRGARDLDGLLAASDQLSLDMAATLGGESFGSSLPESAPGPDALVLDAIPETSPLQLALSSLTEAERAAVLWAAEDPDASRTQIATECGLAPRALPKLLARLAWQLSAPHHQWAATAVELDGQFEELAENACEAVLSLARHGR